MQELDWRKHRIGVWREGLLRDAVVLRRHNFALFGKRIKLAWINKYKYWLISAAGFPPWTGFTGRCPAFLQTGLNVIRVLAWQELPSLVVSLDVLACTTASCNHTDLFPPPNKFTFTPSNYPWKQLLLLHVFRGRLVAESRLEGLLQSFWFLRFSSPFLCLHRAWLCRLLRRAYVQQHAAKLQPGGVLLHCFWSVFPSCHRYRKFYPPPLSLHSHISEMSRSKGSSSGLLGKASGTVLGHNRLM